MKAEVSAKRNLVGFVLVRINSCRSFMFSPTQAKNDVTAGSRVFWIGFDDSGTMVFRVEMVTYWAVLVPVSVVGLVCNPLIIWVLCREKYKFNRLIIMTLEAFNCFFLILFSVWTNIKDLTKDNERYAHMTVFTIRSNIVALHVFLSGMQYLWSRDLKLHRFNKPMFSKHRIIVKLILIFIFCLALMYVSIFAREKLPADQQMLGSAVFRVVFLVVPQLLQARFVVGMVMNVRSKGSPIISTVLESVTTETFSHTDPRLTRKNFQHRLRKTVELIERLSVDSKASSESLVPEKRSAFFAPRICSMLVQNAVREANETKTIIALSIPLLVIFPSILVPQLYFAATGDPVKIAILFTVLDHFQHLAYSCHLFLFMAMTPSFRKSFKKRWSCLWNRGQTCDTMETNKDNRVSPLSASDGSSSSSDEETPHAKKTDEQVSH